MDSSSYKNQIEIIKNLIQEKVNNMEIHGRTFLEFCKEIRGFKVFNRNGIEIYKWELFYQGINPKKILTNQTKFIIRKIDKKNVE